MGFKSMLQQEWRDALKDPRRFIFLFGAAFAYLIVFGMLYLPNIVREIPTVIYDADQSALSRKIVRNIEDSDSFLVAGYSQNEEDMHKSLRNKEAFVAIEIPVDFSRDLAQSGSANILYMANGSNIIMTNVTSSALQNILEESSNALGAERAAMITGIDENIIKKRIATVESRFRILGNPTQGYLYFFLIGLAMAAFQQGILFAMGASLFQEKILTFKKIVAKTMFYQFFAMLSFLLIIALIYYGLGIELKGDFLLLLTLGIAYTFSVLGLCCLFSVFFAEEMQFVRFLIMYPVPAFILSGYTWPQESMGEGMAFLAKFFPLSYLSNNVRDIFLMGNAFHLINDIVMLVILGAACFVLRLIVGKYSSKLLN